MAQHYQVLKINSTGGLGISKSYTSGMAPYTILV